MSSKSCALKFYRAPSARNGGGLLVREGGSDGVVGNCNGASPPAFLMEGPGSRPWEGFCGVQRFMLHIYMDNDSCTSLCIHSQHCEPNISHRERRIYICIYICIICLFKLTASSISDSPHPPCPPTGVSHADSPSRRLSVPLVRIGSTVRARPKSRFTEAHCLA